jgi:hypothetical protein
MTRLWAVLIANLLLATMASAQMPMAKPGPELKKLDYFAGNWTCEGQTQPGPMGPASKETSTAEAKWMDGGFFVVLHSTYKSPMGDGTGISFIGYDTDDKKYTYNEFNSQGEAVVSKGVVDGDAWTWIGDMKMPAGKSRFSEKVLSPTAYTYKFEFSPDGSKWTLFLDGKCTKSK